MIGNGPGLVDLPPEFLATYPSMGSNSIFMHPSFRPTYYCAVDTRVRLEYAEGVMDRFAERAKFIPTPNLDKWRGANFYRFYHRPGALWPYNDIPLWQPTILTDTGITYTCVTHVVLQLLYFMGFDTILCVGMDHQRHADHFWGHDHGSTGTPNFDHWEQGYQELAEGFARDGRRIINVSTRTLVKVLERDDWRNWR